MNGEVAGVVIGVFLLLFALCMGVFVIIDERSWGRNR